MTALEKLARRICWLEFPSRPKDTTEAKYWEGVAPEKKREYEDDARWLVWIHRTLYQSMSSTNVFHEAAEQVSQERKRKAK